ncbi:Uncharacterized protein FWK35_00032855 [Aphis craccivora]|uniref:MADF domain-containing protein n=2 Tax=Aphis craccivora TaxID=307492 RepID=A0A6G0WVW6_APHCR|nr:Uncharacterized protein FWK35_00032855 [Aphis craccivora]
MSSAMVKFTKEQDEILVEFVDKHPPIYNPENRDYKDLNIRDAIWRDISGNVGQSGKQNIINVDFSLLQFVTSSILITLVGYEYLFILDEDYKRRYKNIKDAYLKNKRIRKMNTGASASSKPSKWHLARFLNFLDTVPQERNTLSNLYDTDNNEDSGSDEEEINITQDDILQSSPVRQCLQSPSTSRPQKSTNKRKNLKVTDLLEKRSRERTELMTQLIAKKNTDEYDDVDHFFKSLALSVKKLPPQLISQAKLKMLTIVTDLELQAADNRTHNVHIIPSSGRVSLQTNNSTSSSPYSNNLTQYSYSPPSLDSPSYSSIQQQFGPTNTTTFTPFQSVQNMNNEWNTNSHQ